MGYIPPPPIMFGLHTQYPECMQRNFKPWVGYFAWSPVRLENGKLAWLRQVYKRSSFIPLLGWRSSEVEYTDSVFDVLRTTK